MSKARKSTPKARERGGLIKTVYIQMRCEPEWKKWLTDEIKKLPGSTITSVLIRGATLALQDLRRK